MSSICRKDSVPQLTLLINDTNNSDDLEGVNGRLTPIREILEQIDDCNDDVEQLKLLTPKAVRALNSITDDDFYRHPELMFTVGEEIDRIKSINERLEYEFDDYTGPTVYEYQPFKYTGSFNLFWAVKLKECVSISMTNITYLWEYSVRSCKRPRYRYKSTSR